MFQQEVLNRRFDSKVLFISGGICTFGNAVLRRFLNTTIREIRVLSRDEKKQEDMRRTLKNPLVKFIIGDVRAADSLLPARQGVDNVFHAVALKQVPYCAFFPLKALRTNALGAENVMDAIEANCNGGQVHLAPP